MSEEKQDKKKQQKGHKTDGGHKAEGGHKGEGQAKGPRPDSPSKRKSKNPAPETQVDDGTPLDPAPPPRLLIHFREKVVPELKQKFNYTNNYAVPRLEKIVISMGLGKIAAAGEKAKVDQAEKELSIIA